MKNSIHIDYTCPRCDCDTDVMVSLPEPAQTYGPPEKCYPAYGGEISPEECEHCGHTIDFNDAVEEGIEKAVGQREAAEEAKYDAMVEERIERL